MSEGLQLLIGIPILAALLYYHQPPQPNPATQVYLPGATSPRECKGEVASTNLANGDRLITCWNPEGTRVAWQVRIIGGR